MQISRVQVTAYRIPLPTVFSSSRHGQIPDIELVCVRLEDDEGAEGLGYTYTIGQGGLAIRAMIAHDLAPILLGQDPRRIEWLWQQMWWRLHWVGRGGAAALAVAAVDIALWDLKARRLGEPLWRLLGGHQPEVEVYAGGIDMQFTLEQLKEQTRGFLAEGFRAIKMKVGRQNIREDIDRVAAIRELIGPDIPLMVDANMNWRVDQAIAAARTLRNYDVLWLEEPTIPDDTAGYVEIRRQGGMPIAAGENLHTIYEFRHLIASGGVSYVQPDAANCGGITPWLKIARLAEAYNLPVTSHGVHDIHVHLLAAVPNASYAEVHRFGLEQFMDQPLEFQGGKATAPNRPGHGVQLREEPLAEFLEQP